MTSLKNLLFLLVISLSITTYGKGAFQIGPKVGMNIYSLLNPANGYTSNFGVDFQAGFTMSIGMGDSSNFSIRPELLYHKTGAEMEEYIYGNYTNLASSHTTSIHNTSSMSFHYIQVPILLNYQFSGGMSFVIGPYFGYLLNAKNDTSVFVSFKDSANVAGNIAKSSTVSGAIDILNAMNKLDIGAAIGLSYESVSGLGFQLRYSYGFTTAINSKTFINPSTKVATYQAAYGNNSVISLSIYKLF